MALDTTNALISLDMLKDYLGFAIAAEQVVTVQFVKDTAGSLGGKYWYISSPTVDYYVWYDVANGSDDPSVSGRTGIEVDIASGNTANVVAANTETALEATGAFTVTGGGANRTVTNVVTGRCSIPQDVDTSFTIILQEAGQDDDSAHDNNLNEHINRASEYLNTMTGRKLLARSLTEYYDGDASNTLIVREYPINSITSIYIDADRSYGSDTLVSSDDYTYYSDEGIVRFDGSTGVGSKAIKITYNAGYSTVPADLEAACVQISAVDHFREERKSIGLTSITNETGQSKTFTDDDRLVDSVINKYKRKYR